MSNRLLVTITLAKPFSALQSLLHAGMQADESWQWPEDESYSMTQILIDRTTGSIIM